MRILFALSVGAIALASFGAGVLHAQSPDWDSIASKIVQHSLSVQPGETVIVTGGPTQVELLGALQVATKKAGGHPIVQLDIPAANKRSLMETPIEYLGQPPLYKIQQMRDADCFIDVRFVQQPGLFADVPEERIAADRRSAELLVQAFRRAHFRRVTLGQTGGIPSVAYAKSQGARYEDMIAMFWSALDVDYDQLIKSGQSVATKLKSRSQLRLVTATGTDLTFKIGTSPPRLNSGRTADNVVASGVAQVWLPAGEIYACTDPKTANGTLVVPHLSFRGVPTTNIRMTFKAGRMTEFKADKNAMMLQEFFKFAKGDIGVLSVVDIGLNPNSHPLTGSPYASFEMGSIVTLGIGNSLWAGCDVESDDGLSMHIAGATLTVDGIPLVDNGRLYID